MRNQTTNKPAAGDEVVLLRLENGMEQESTTRTDAQGSFVLPMGAGNTKHVIRVWHKGVNYDQGLNGKGPLEIAVFDSVPRIRNLQGRIGLVQVESDGAILKVTEMYTIDNQSVPQVTQSRADNFEISLLPNAAIDSVAARKDGGAWVNITPVPIPGYQGGYAVDFPIRPGGTQFKFIYHLPYAGPATLHVRLAYPVKSFAVMHPQSLTFKSSVPAAFTSPGMTQGLQVEQAVAKPLVREIPAFEISGMGFLPPATQAVASSKAGHSSEVDSPISASSAAHSTQFGLDRQETGMWAILSGIVALLAASLYGVWRRRKKALQRT
ncbi:MAG TPA: hypothetical protein VIK39_08225 [Candidatus Angelobacter sp.]